jgi:hypothetical protein
MGPVESQRPEISNAEMISGSDRVVWRRGG